ncbi:MAG: hypothetical protein MUF48_20110 [Pirellulaceae bacterium]|nr:hypothetical protein [Pirellulaceae bacterium]
MWKYLKAAFQNRWNLLALFGAAGAAVISNRPDVLLPLVVAAEVGYLAVVASHPKFHQFVDVQEHQAQRQQRAQSATVALKQILSSLPRPLIDRYNRLRERCLELQQIAVHLRQSVATGDEAAAPLESLQVESLDKLLWIYLRLLYTSHGLQQFLDKTSRDRISRDVDRIEQRLAEIAPQDTSPHAEKLRRTLQDNLATSQDRLRNYDRAQANFEYVELEIDRLENKIKSLAEVAVNRQEPDFVASQVDLVARSMLDTEKTMNDLQVFTGLATSDEAVPVLLQPTRVSAR